MISPPRLGRFFAASIMLAIMTTVARAQVVVTTVPASSILIAVDYDIAASVVAANDSQLSSPVTARVSEIYADVGQTVRKGELLISLQPRDFRLALSAAEADLRRVSADLALAQSRLARQQQLAGQDYVSEDTIADHLAQVASLEAQEDAQQTAVEQARAALSDTVIRAPFDGVVIRRSAQLGSLLQAGTNAIRLVQIRGVEVEARVTADALPALVDAQQVAFYDGRRTWPLELLRVSPVIETDSRLQQVRLSSVDDSNPPPGQPGRLQWQSAPEFLPVPYIQRRGQKLGVFVAEDGRARFVPLENAAEGHPTRLEMPADTRIIDRGRERLQPGDAIKTESP